MGNNQIMGRKCDVSKSDEVNNLVKEILDKYGRIDVLINNAGITYVKKLVDTTEEEWDYTLDINLKGVFLLSKAILPQMMKNNFGIIINVSSGAGKVGFRRHLSILRKQIWYDGLNRKFGMGSWLIMTFE